MRQRVALEAAKKLRSHFVAGSKQEEIEKNRLYQCRNFDVELPDQYTGEERADNSSKAEAADLDAPDRKADGEREEDSQFRILLQGFDKVVHRCCFLIIVAASSSR